MEVRTQRLDDYEINALAPVRVIRAGNVVDINYTSGTHEQTIKTLEDGRYLVLSTGEVKKQTKHSETRAENKDALKRTFSRMRQIINANTADPERCRWITLTYADNMQDDKRLSGDLNACIRRLHKKFGEFEWIAIREPQGRGSWHEHVIVIFRHKAPFMSNEAVREAWGQGFVTCRAMFHGDSLGNYLSCYLTDIPLSDARKLGIDGEVVTKDVQHGKKTVAKRFIKGGRLSLYPAGMNYYTFSKGIQKPEEEQIPYHVAKEVVRGAIETLHNDYEILMTMEDGNTVRRVVAKRQYNYKRKKE